MTSVEPIKRLTHKEKVSVNSMREVLKSAMDEKLGAETLFKYDGDECAKVTKELTDTVRDRLNALRYDRYKFVVQVVIGERREQGFRSGTRCFWDSGTDSQATETFMNDNIFASATAFAVYLY